MKRPCLSPLAQPFPLSAAPVVFLGLALLCGCQKSRGPEIPAPTKAENPGVLVEVVRPIVQPVPHTLKAVGSFLAEDEVEISAETDGRVAEIFVDEGYPLEQGQVLLRLDRKKPRLQKERAEAEVREALADLELQELTLKRQAELLREGVIAQQAYDNVAARTKLARARLQRAQALLRLARKALEDTTVVSPLNGTLTERLVAVGEYVKAGQPLFTAVKTNPLKLYFTLPERLAGKVRTGQRVEVWVKAYPAQAFSGQIYFINPQVDPQTRTLQIKARVDNQEGLLKPGFFAEVQLVLEVHENALVLPQEAVVLREDQTLVYVVTDGTAEEREVELGERFNGKVEILSGIGPQDLVVTSGNQALKHGQVVRVMDQRAPQQTVVYQG